MIKPLIKKRGTLFTYHETKYILITPNFVKMKNQGKGGKGSAFFVYVFIFRIGVEFAFHGYNTEYFGETNERK